MDLTTERTLHALENIAAELERLRVLKEYELGVVVEDQPDPTSGGSTGTPRTSA